MNRTLIIFARKPELGKVKTRLAKDIGTKKALEIYTQLLDQSITISNQVDAEIKLYWSEKVELGVGYFQKGKELGVRMYNALRDEINANKVCLIGTDTPSITSSIIDNAFRSLDEYDMVFGPSKDGGYYLVAIKELPNKELFLNKSWSHQNVLNDALNTCKELALKVKLMPTLLDIDTVDDYNEWQNFT